MRPADFTGVLLAGGQSRRFGTNKALAEVAGCRLIEHPARVLAALFPRRLLVTNTPDLYRFLEWPTTSDLLPGNGPLGGIQAALSRVETPYIFVAGCDMPDLDPELIALLCDRAPGYDAVLPVTAAGPEPLHAVYGRTALAPITAALAGGIRKIQAVLAQLRVLEIGPEQWPGTGGNFGRSFRNINTPADLPDEVR